MREVAERGKVILDIVVIINCEDGAEERWPVQFSMTQYSHTMTNEHDGKGQVLSSWEEIDPI